jgi:hypothetical protein
LWFLEITIHKKLHPPSLSITKMLHFWLKNLLVLQIWMKHEIFYSLFDIPFVETCCLYFLLHNFFLSELFWRLFCKWIFYGERTQYKIGICWKWMDGVPFCPIFYRNTLKLIAKEIFFLMDLVVVFSLFLSSLQSICLINYSTTYQQVYSNVHSQKKNVIFFN